MIALMRRRYGAGPLHLMAHLAAFGVAGFAIAQILQAREPVNIIVWLVGAAVLHDLAFVPAYSILDRLGRVAGAPLRRASVPVVNHVRFVVVVSGALLLVYFPLILHRATGNYVQLSGRQPANYGATWLRITAALALVSALAYAARLALRARRGVEDLQQAVGPAADEDASGA